MEHIPTNASENSFDESDESVQSVEESAPSEGTLRVTTEGDLIDARLDALKDSMGWVPLSLEATGGISDVDAVHGFLADPSVSEEAKKKFLELRASFANGGSHGGPYDSYVLYDPKEGSFSRIERL